MSANPRLTGNQSFDFAGGSSGDRPRKIRPPVSHLSVANGLPVQELRQAYALKDFKKAEGCPWPTAVLPKSEGNAQLLPIEIDENPVLSPERELCLAEAMLAECDKLSDWDADVLDALSYFYLQRARSPIDDVRVSVNEILGLRGLRPRLSGDKHRGGYALLQRAMVVLSLTRIGNTWLTFSDRCFNRRKGEVFQTRCFVVTERKGQFLLDGQFDTREFWFRPGPTYGAFLFGKWRQTALLAARALEYDPVQQSWEKRIARFLSWQWRIRANFRTYFQPMKVRMLLDVVQPNMPLARPGRILSHFEKCLDVLSQDGVITAWQYDGWPSLLGEPRRWKDEWSSANVLIEPPDQIRDAYKDIGNRHSGDSELGARIRSSRKVRKLSILRASEELRMTPAQLDLFECGRKEPSTAEQKALEKWMAG